MTTVFKLNQVTKQFDDVMALNNIDLTIEKGRVYGLIGRNGAGKTTLLKVLSGMVATSKGQVMINQDIVKTTTDIAFAKDYNHYFIQQKIKTIFKIARDIYPRWDQAVADDLIDHFELNIKKNYIKASKGMQTMTSLIIALAAQPEVLLLDEPYSGLDPINREFFYNYLRNHYFDGQKTVVISSHIIKEVEGYFERAIIIHKGEIILHENVEKIYKKSYIVEGPKEIKSYLGHKNILATDQLAGQYKIYIYDQLDAQLLERLKEEGASISQMDLQTLMVKQVSQEGM